MQLAAIRVRALLALLTTLSTNGPAAFVRVAEASELSEDHEAHVRGLGREINTFSFARPGAPAS